MAKKKRTEWAEAVLTHIPATDKAEPVSVAFLMEMTGLTNYQVREGVAELREIFTGQGEAPLLSGPKGYLFSFDGAKVGAFRQSRAKTAHTNIRRLYLGCIKRYVASLPAKDKSAKLITKQFDRVLEDLGELIGAGV